MTATWLKEQAFVRIGVKFSAFLPCVSTDLPDILASVGSALGSSCLPTYSVLTTGAVQAALRPSKHTLERPPVRGELFSGAGRLQLGRMG